MKEPKSKSKAKSKAKAYGAGQNYLQETSHNLTQKLESSTTPQEINLVETLGKKELSDNWLKDFLNIPRIPEALKGLKTLRKSLQGELLNQALLLKIKFALGELRQNAEAAQSLPPGKGLRLLHTTKETAIFRCWGLATIPHNAQKKKLIKALRITTKEIRNKALKIILEAHLQTGQPQRSLAEEAGYSVPMIQKLMADVMADDRRVNQSKQANQTKTQKRNQALAQNQAKGKNLAVPKAIQKSLELTREWLEPILQSANNPEELNRLVSKGTHILSEERIKFSLGIPALSAQVNRLRLAILRDFLEEISNKRIDLAKKVILNTYQRAKNHIIPPWYWPFTLFHSYVKEIFDRFEISYHSNHNLANQIKTARKEIKKARMKTIQHVFQHAFLHGDSQSSLARKIGITPARVCQICISLGIKMPTQTPNSNIKPN